MMHSLFRGLKIIKQILIILLKKMQKKTFTQKLLVNVTNIKNWQVTH